MKQFEIVKAEIERKIVAGTYPVSAALPRLEELAEEQSCSVATVRRALRDLIEAGVVISAKKRGTVVLRKPAAGRAVIFLSPEAHTNVILQEPICTALTQAHFDVDIMAGGVGETALRNWCRRLLAEERAPDALVILGAGSPQLTGTFSDEILGEFFPRQVCVGLDVQNCTVHEGISWVVPDWRQQARALAEFLLKLGHRRAAIFAGSVHGQRGWYGDLADQFRELWEVANGTCWFHHSADGLDHLLELVRQEGVTAYVDLNDNVAMSTLGALQSAGLRVPEDVSLVGRHDTPWAEAASPPLTSLSLNPQGIADTVCEAVGTLAKGNLKGNVYHVDPLIAERRSTAPLAMKAPA